MENVIYFCKVKENKREIIIQILPIFRRYGIKSITMDDIARNLGISKKTLYKYFCNKNDLVKSVIDYRIAQIRNQIKDQISESDNAIDEIIRISSTMYNYLKKITPATQFDLSKYYKPAGDTFNQFQQKHVKTTVINNLKRGMDEGLYRKNLQTELIADFFLAIIKEITAKNHLQNETEKILNTHIEMVRYHIRGIASHKGMDYLLERIKKEEIKF